ncbi:MAG: hypothetical protein L0154_02790 [Chloroflexi bacterium]|nr:hypothetical protein [Chloroflexota bacterium]
MAILNRQRIWQHFLTRDFSSYRYLVGVLLVVFPIYFYGVYRQWNANQDRQKVDQHAYIQYSKEIATEFIFRGDHNRMPLYPALQALHYSSGESDEAFFREGKAVNVGLSGLMLIGIALLWWRIMGPLSATVAIILTMVFVYPPITPYFTVEVLFFALFLACLMLAGYLLVKPSLKLATGLGVLFGITHLAKGSILLLIVIFVLIYAMKALVEHRNIKRLGYHSLVVLAVVLSFLVTVYPYIADTKAVFGSYFYNVNTTFYIWYDSWSEVTQGTRAYGDREHYPDMPAEDIPGMAKYLCEHSVVEDIAGRFTYGFSKNFVDHTLRSYGYGKYILAYAILLAGITYQRPDRTWRFIKQHRWLVLYVALSFVAYQAAFAWYLPISSGKRFLLTLWLPCVTVMFWLTSYLKVYRFHVICLGIMLVDVVFVWSEKVGHYIH